MNEGHDIDENAQHRVLFIRNMEDPYFKKHFRMSRACFERLVTVLENHRVATGQLMRMRTPTVDATLMGVWLLFNPDTFRSTGLNFDASPSVHHFHYKRLIHTLCEIGARYIKWPHQRDRQRISLFYERRFGFPGIVGAIDGTLIPITAPREQKQRYVDKNHDYSMNVMIVGDHKRLIRDIYIGQPGSVNDVRVFRRSPFARSLYTRNDMLNANEHIVGDKAYILTGKVITPYRDNGNLTPSHRNYNFMLSQCRSSIERLNMLLKGRLLRLKKLFTRSIETTVSHIGAAAVLHNFILLEGDEMEGMVFDGPVHAMNIEAAIQADRPAGHAKRENIRAQLDENAAHENEGNDEEE